MQEKIGRGMLGIALAAVAALLLAGPATADVAGKSYTTWVSASFAGSPFTPFQDCYRFSATVLTIVGCADSGPFVQFPGIIAGLDSQFVSLVDCGGLNLLLLGTSVDGAPIGFQANTMGGNILGITERTAFAIEGIQDQCPAFNLDAGGYSQ
jgi:hypothetical protein